ncbi:MAG: alpha/beta hydrolase [Candidatus Promineifilaceae bacterium]|nr:alpha/beta hydrolase [Candidatus Promineifilaceae bacterium]
MSETIPAAERRIRAILPVIRFMHAYLPLSLQRWLIEQGMARVELPPDIRREPASANGVRAEWLIPRDSPADRALLYLHGGSFILGLTSLHLEMVAYLARKMGARALLVDYRLAPEHPFPAALEDCVSAYRWLLQQGILAQQVTMAGDSAGGNLTLTSLMKLRDDGQPLPAAAACLSPVADLSGKRNRFRQIHDPLLHPKSGRAARRSYVADHQAHAPTISPVYGEWRDLPPLLIHAGADEVLRYDARLVAELAQAAGVDARVEIYPRMWHVWQLFMTLPQALQSLDDIARFLKAKLEPPAG